MALLSFVWFGVALSILFGSFHVLVCRKEPDGAWRVAMEHIG